jgi:hypothetical protein
VWKKLETKRTSLDEQIGGRPKINPGFGSEWDTLYKVTASSIPDNFTVIIFKKQNGGTIFYSNNIQRTKW